jgi:hypothetical protein
MKRVLVVGVMFLFFLTPAAFSQISVSGNLQTLGAQNASGANTFARFTLVNYGGALPQVSGTTVAVTDTQDFHTNGSGAISGSIYGNDAISPTGTLYQVCIFNNGIQFRCANYSITAALNPSGFNLNTAQPVVTTPGNPSQVTGARSFVFTQSSSATTWVINHNFNDTHPVVACYNLSGTAITPSSVVVTDPNDVTVTFSSPQTGTCNVISAGYLNLSTNVPNAVVTNPGGAQTVQGPNAFNVGGPLNAAGGVNTGKVNSAVYLDGTTYAQTDAGLTAAIAAAGNNSTVVIPANATVAITSQHTITNTSFTLRCEPGAVLNYGANWEIVFTGANVRAEGCSLNGPGTGTPTSAPMYVTGAHSTLTNLTVTNFGSTSGNGELDAVNAMDVSIHDNILYNNIEGIEVQSPTASASTKDILVENNRVDCSAGGSGGSAAACIVVLANGSGSTAQGVIVSGNKLVGGNQGCMLIGPFGGASFKDLAVTDNYCRLTTNLSGAQPDAIGVAGVTNFNVSSNVIQAAGFSNDGIEINQTTGTQSPPFMGIVSNNILYEDGTTGSSYPILLDVCAFCDVSGNSINGFSLAASAIYIGKSTASANVSNNHVHGNMIHLSSGAAVAAIWIQCNATGVTCNQNAIDGNYIWSDGTGGSQGIQIVGVGGSTVSGNSIGPNFIYGPSTGIFIGSGVTNTAISPQAVNTAATPITDNGTGTVKPTGTGGVVQATSPAITSPTLTTPTIGGGSALNHANYFSTASITPTAVTAATCSDQTFAVTGVSTGDKLGAVIPPGALGNVSVNADVSAANTVRLHFCNPSAVSVTPPAGVYSFLDFN